MTKSLVKCISGSSLSLLDFNENQDLNVYSTIVKGQRSKFVLLLEPVECNAKKIIFFDA